MLLLRRGALAAFLSLLMSLAASAEPKPNPAPKPDQPAEKPDDVNLKPEEVLVVANKSSKGSLEVAQYYMGRRNIPPENLVQLDFPNYQHPNGISYEDFDAKAVAPIKKHLEERNLKDKILCIVTTYDVPYIVNGPNFSKEEMDELTKRLPEPNRGNAGAILTTRASFDSELAWLYRGDVYSQPLQDIKRRSLYCYSTPNLYLGQTMKFRQFRKEVAQHPKFKDAGNLYMTARLDGPSVEAAKALVDLGTQAELEGPSGTGYFDSKGKTFGKRKLGYSMGEFWARRAWIDANNAGFKTVKEETGNLLGAGACPDALIYWGWYALTNYQNSFTPKFRPGAIAVHTASFEATNLRVVKDQGGEWCAGFLKQGVTVCAGPVAEPFLAAFPNAEIFYPRIYGGWTAGEAYWNSMAQLSWMMVLIGDPLYTPFGGKHKRANYVQGIIQFGNPGAAALTMQPASSQKVVLVIQLKANTPIFKKTDAYKVLDPGTNGANTKLVDLDKARFEVKDEGTLLVVTGPCIETGVFGPPNPQREDGDELEIHFDLGPDGGKKILSQLFVGLPPAMK